MMAETGQRSFNDISCVVDVAPAGLAGTEYKGVQCAVAVTCAVGRVSMYGYTADLGEGLVLEQHVAMPGLSNSCSDEACRMFVRTDAGMRAYIPGGPYGWQRDLGMSWAAEIEFGIGLDALEQGGARVAGDCYTHDKYTVQQVAKELTAQGHRIAHPALHTYVQSRYCL